MILLDYPYVSDFLIQTIKTRNIPVLKNEFSLRIPELARFLWEETDFIEQLKKHPETRLYSTTENAIAWISNQLQFLGLEENIRVFKDKVLFRELIQSVYPNFFFRKVPISELTQLDITEFPIPFVIKPSVGFFSLGVYPVHSREQWPKIVSKIQAEIGMASGFYPKEVLNTDYFIIEEYIEGEEFAFDAYVDELGNPVLLNVFKHYFADSDDVSDRVYYTSKEMLTENLTLFTHFLQELTSFISLKNFPIHIEVRKTPQGKLIPIEANPFRFGGWCTTADITPYAFGFNPYDYFLSGQKPDWDSVLEKMNTNLYSIVVLNNSTGINGKDIAAFNYEALQKTFSTVLELRKVSVQKYPLFGFLFVETHPELFSELETIAKSSLKEFVKYELEKSVEIAE